MSHLSTFLERRFTIEYKNLCDQYYLTNKFVGQGSNSSVFQAATPQQYLKGKKPSYVYKEIYDPEIGGKEIMAAELGVAPPTEMIECNEEIYLLQKKMDGTFVDFWIENPKLRDEALQQVSELIKKWWSVGMVHNDLNSSNIVYKKSKDRFYFYLIDFEYAQSFRDKVLSKKERKKMIDKDRYITISWPYLMDRMNTKVFLPGLPKHIQ